jgi:hypothetical protein
MRRQPAFFVFIIGVMLVSSSFLPTRVAKSASIEHVRVDLSDNNLTVIRLGLRTQNLFLVRITDPVVMQVSTKHYNNSYLDRNLLSIIFWCWLLSLCKRMLLSRSSPLLCKWECLRLHWKLSRNWLPVCSVSTISKL